MFVFIPTDGAAQLVRQHVSTAAISDRLGGAIPVSLLMQSRPLALHVRQDCATAGLARNRLAGMVAFVLSGLPKPMVGPVCISPVVRLGDSGDGVTALGAQGCFDADTAGILLRMCNDLWAALNGYEQLLPTVMGARLTREDWALSVRQAADQIDLLPIPRGFPYPPGRPADRIADGLARHGIHVRRGPHSADLL